MKIEKRQVFSSCKKQSYFRPSLIDYFFIASFLTQEGTNQPDIRRKETIFF